MDDPLPVGPLLFAAGARRLLRGDQEVARLKGAEARLLGRLLAESVVARVPGQRGVDQAASDLRRTLADVSEGRVRVLSERGVGYRLVVDGVEGMRGVVLTALLVAIERRADATGRAATTLVLRMVERAPELDVGQPYRVVLAPVG